MRGRSENASASVGQSIDFLGYEFSRENVRLRKTIKKRFAYKYGKVKSRKRRKQIEDSYKGWCLSGKCRHLWKTITGKDMGFAEKGISFVKNTTREGQKFFDVRLVSIPEIINVPMTVLDFEKNIPTRDIHDHSKTNLDRYVVLVRLADGQKVKFITSALPIKDVLDQCDAAEEAGRKVFPVENVTIKRKDIGNGKISYQFIDL